ncbi:uncharacterized protein LOC129003412 [Macrosteles quadrilineatus]|uniref:uncharacterized protein LOC129003412 n=1 Tax=Macrosteles quadrilineatus TaxID=74068 RepID=UPI0023E18ABD|nr:uncharacterized protein LOC129003412 [Macrosteles quadrilineatus]
MSDHNEEFKPEEMEGVEIPESQIPESQSSCETLMSQQSHVMVLRVDKSLIISSKPENEFWEIPTEKAVEVSDVKPADKTVNSSLEANTSGENNGNSHSRIILPRQSLESSVQEQDPSITDEGLGGKSQNDMFEDDKEEDDRLTKQETRKRKSRSDDSTPSPKRPRRSIPIEISSDDNHSVENQDLSVLEISATPEKTIIIDDSQEFSLRIEEEPSATQVKAEVSQKEVTGVKAPTTVSPTISTQSQKNVLSWSSQTQQLTWDSHKYTQDVKTFMAGDSCSQPSEYEKNSPSESCVGKPIKLTYLTCGQSPKLKQKSSNDKLRP